MAAGCRIKGYRKNAYVGDFTFIYQNSFDIFLPIMNTYVNVGVSNFSFDGVSQK